LLVALLTGCGRGDSEQAPIQHAPAVESARYVGRAICKECHAAQDRLWSGSHHDLAMQPAVAATVLGNFDDANFRYGKVATTFFRRGGKYFVRTDGPGGKLQDFEIRYTFGVAPLQQYLIPLNGGRLQALSIAWDSRPKGEGGQRWFHLYPKERVTHEDELHWTGPEQNWNFMCAECHSTDLKKNYDAGSRTYRTTWSEINVSCEACHGPGSQHAAWARERAKGGGAAKGAPVSLGSKPRAAPWTIDPRTGSARPRASGLARAELETCAPCHARRASIAAGFEAGKPLLDHYLPALLEPPLYHVDGQIREEAYEHGSFLQSRMAHAGVACSDCHEPHSLKLRAGGNALCAPCHAPAKYDAPSHHFHEAEGPGARCVACHMPEKTYMLIDRRRDHSIRVPRPDLSVALGVPNACAQCHADRPSRWAARSVERWYGHAPSGFQKFAEAFHDQSREEPGAGERLAALLADPGQPAIVRATAAAAIARAPDPAGMAAARGALGDADALVRHAALGTVDLLPPEERADAAAALLDDPSRAVRIEAARLLAPSAAALTAARRASFERAAAEYVAAQNLNADRPENRVNLGSFYAQLGRPDEAEAEFREALRLRRAYVPAWVNFADMRRAQSRDREAEGLLREGLEAAPDDASLHHALGLALIRLQRRQEAEQSLSRAAMLAPDDPRFAYVHAVALESLGRRREARAALERALERHPNNPELLGAAAHSSRDAGARAAALRYAERLVARTPWDPAARRLLESLRATPAR
jgi:Flp pilus assembly protein TadD